jgi:hypothetical protein
MGAFRFRRFISVAWLGRSRLGMARSGTDWPGPARQGMVWFDFRQFICLAGWGRDWRGETRRGSAGQGRARLGSARLGMVWLTRRV